MIQKGNGKRFCADAWFKRLQREGWCSPSCGTLLKNMGRISIHRRFLPLFNTSILLSVELAFSLSGFNLFCVFPVGPPIPVVEKPTASLRQNCTRNEQARFGASLEMFKLVRTMYCTFYIALLCVVASISTILQLQYSRSSKEVWKLNFRQHGEMKKHYSSAEAQTWRKSEERRCRCAKR